MSYLNQDISNPFYSIKTAAVQRMVRRIAGYVKAYSGVKIGFLSKARGLKRRVWANILLPESGAKTNRISRNPIAKFLEDKEQYSEAWELLEQEVLKVIEQGAESASRGEDYRFAPHIQDAFNFAGQYIAEQIKSTKFLELEPVKPGTEFKHEDLTPLVETGELRESIKVQKWSKPRGSYLFPKKIK